VIRSLIGLAGRANCHASKHGVIGLTKSDVVDIPPETKHWHGAAKDSWFSHVAVEVPADDGSTEWLEPVSDEEYKRLP